jgi:hypothetical protein
MNGGRTRELTQNESAIQYSDERELNTGLMISSPGTIPPATSTRRSAKGEWHLPERHY